MWPPLWSSGQSSWLQIQRASFDSLRYQIFWEVVGQERCPLSLVSTIEELLERKSSGCGRENGDYGVKGSSALTTRHRSVRKKLALTPPASDGRSLGIARGLRPRSLVSVRIKEMWVICWYVSWREALCCCRPVIFIAVLFDLGLLFGNVFVSLTLPSCFPFISALLRSMYRHQSVKYYVIEQTCIEIHI
jgi:hypothetical protein